MRTQKTRLTRILFLTLSACCCGIPAGSLRGQILVNDGAGIGEFNTDGTPVNTSFISGIPVPQGIAISGNNLFVANWSAGTIGQYTLFGTTVNASFITGLNQPEGIAISGNSLYVANWGNGTIGQYTTSGTVLNAGLISGLNTPDGIASSAAPVCLWPIQEAGQLANTPPRGAPSTPPSFPGLAVRRVPAR